MSIHVAVTQLPIDFGRCYGLPVRNATFVFTYLLLHWYVFMARVELLYLCMYIWIYNRWSIDVRKWRIASHQFAMTVNQPCLIWGTLWRLIYVYQRIIALKTLVQSRVIWTTVAQPQCRHLWIPTQLRLHKHANAMKKTGSGAALMRRYPVTSVHVWASVVWFNSYLKQLDQTLNESRFFAATCVVI